MHICQQELIMILWLVEQYPVLYLSVKMMFKRVHTSTTSQP